MVIRGLKSGSIYVFQVRARTVAGFGRYSGKLYFQTMTEGEKSVGAGAGTQRSNHLPLGVGSGVGVGGEVVGQRHTRRPGVDTDSCHRANGPNRPNLVLASLRKSQSRGHCTFLLQ